MSSISSVAGSGPSFTGLASGIDTDKLVEGLLAVQQARVTTLQRRQERSTFLQTTVKTLQSQVLDLQTQTWRLGRSVNGAFDNRLAAVSDEAITKAAAGSAAVPGNYTFQVNQLAKAHQIASAGIVDGNASLKTGTLQLKVGDGQTTTITVDSSNNTLQGLANAINNANGEVAASVVNDGTATPFRLLLTAKKTGLANDIEVTNNLATGTGVAIDLNPATRTIQQSQDAQIVLGSGAGALTVNSASNKVDSLISGVTLDLQSADPAKTVTLTVSNDTETGKKAVQDLVASFNKVIDFIDERDDFDPQTNQAGSLLGDSLAADLQEQLSRSLGAVVPGVATAANRLSAIGVTFTDKGRLQIDETKLDKALSGQLTGVSLSDVRKLFATSGTSTNPNVSFILATSKTKATTSPIEVNLTQVARQASLTATNAPAGSVLIGAGNKDVTLTVNGSTATIQLAEGTYDATTLAAELQGKINTSTALGGSQVTVGVDGGNLRVTTTAYGASAKVTFTSGSALGDLGFTAGQTAAGQDVAGSFKVNGVTETATGSGRILSGRSGNANTDGLQLNVTLAEGQLNADPNVAEAQLTITRGLATELDNTITRFVDGATGRFLTADKGYQRAIDDIKEAITRQNEFIEARRESLVRRFAAMEATIGKLQALGTSLTGQLASLSNLRSSR